MDLNPPDLGSSKSPLATLAKRKHPDSASRNITQKRYNIRKEQKKLDNEYEEKLTKLSNEHKRQIEDIAAERERRLRDLKLQEDDIDFEELLLAQPDSPHVTPEPEFEVITISDDDKDGEEVKIESELSDIIPTNCEHQTKHLNAIRSTETESFATPEADLDVTPEADSDDDYVDPKELRSICRNKGLLTRSEQKACIKSQSKSSNSSTMIRTHTAGTSSTAHQQSIREFLLPTTSPIVPEDTTTSIKEANTTNPLGEPRMTRAHAKRIAKTTYERPTTEERTELETMFIQKIIIELLKHLETRLSAKTRESFLDRVKAYDRKPRRFFAYVVYMAKTQTSNHSSCCAIDGSGTIACWKESMLDLLATKKREFWNCMTRCDRLGVNHEQRKRWVVEWPDVSDEK